MMEVYLDNSATTRCSGRVREIVLKAMEEDFGNPSSMHHIGAVAESYVTEAALKIAKTLKVQEKEICFTSGGTESNNLAIIGAAMANQRMGKRLITTQVEHPSVSNAMAFLESQGFEVIYLPVDKNGIVSLDALREAVNDGTVLVSIMHINNEIGAIEPIEQASAIVHERNPKALFHVDAVQSYGKMQIRPKKMGIDLLSVSGHKIHGPKGIGFLYIKDKTKIKPILFGGGQQMGLRPGTHNVPGIAGLGEAAEEIYEGFEDKIGHLYHLKEIFAGRAMQLDGISINGQAGRQSAPHILNLSAEGVRSEVLLHALEEYGIYVSAGSACSSNKPSPSPTLKAIQAGPGRISSAIRVSFCSDITQEEAEYAALKFLELVPKLRRYQRH